MPKISLQTITNYLMFLTLSIFSAGCLYLFIMMLISRLQGDTPSPVIPWTTLQVGFVLIIIPFVGKRLYAKIVAAPEEVELPRNAGLFVGFLQGLLYGGAILVLAGAGLFCFAPHRLFTPDISYYALAIAGITGLSGACYPPVRVARKARLWLLIALIAQFVAISTIRQMLGLYPLKFDYNVEILNWEKMPLADRNMVTWLVPDDARDIHIYGIRGVEARCQCKVTPEQLKKFAEKHKFELEHTDRSEFAFGNNEFVVFIYNRETETLTGYFKRDGLPARLLKPAKPSDNQQ